MPKLKLTTERLLRGLVTDEQLEELQRRLRLQPSEKKAPQPRDKMVRAHEDK